MYILLCIHLYNTIIQYNAYNIIYTIHCIQYNVYNTNVQNYVYNTMYSVHNTMYTGGGGHENF